MKPKLLLRIASIAILIHGLGHIMGHSGWKTPKDPGQQAVVKQMLEYKAPFMGPCTAWAITLKDSVSALPLCCS